MEVWEKGSGHLGFPNVHIYVTFSLKLTYFTRIIHIIAMLL